MFRDTKAFSSFSTDDTARARQFYEGTLGLNVTDQAEEGVLGLHLAGGGEVVIYPKDDHVPAIFTVLNFQVDDLATTVMDLKRLGIDFEHYEFTDENGISTYEPKMAWFKDPAGNIISVVQA